MFEKLKNLFKKQETIEPAKTEVKKPKVKEKKSEPILTDKEKATMAGEPYINVLALELDPENLHSGAFELDWNDKFILNLIRAGYKMKEDDTDTVIVDRWFQTVCRNIALEVYEQEQADPTNRELRNIRTRDLGNGRTEVS